MSETAFWNSDWLETQQKYWQAWTDMGLQAMGGKTAATTPWEGALDHWWQTLAPTAPQESKAFIDKLLDQGKMFFRLAEDFHRNLGQTPGMDDWSAAVQKTFSDPLGIFRAGAGAGDDENLHRVMAFWELPFDNWQRMVSSLSLMPGDVLRNMPHDQVKDGLHRFLSAPGLGYAREEHGQYQDLVRRGINYQNTLQEYMKFFSNLGLKSAERMRERLEALSGEDKVIDSARGLYDLWVGSCEDVYAEQVMTPEYALLHGKLVNALMALKHRLTTMVDETLGAMNMPTRAELRTLQDRLQETRRENKLLRQDLDALKVLVAALDAGTAPAPVVALAAETKKGPARRKSSAGKAESKSD
jgi:class III poly(R)-hydroxyalkanoic acid synthase PhaE subunit